MPAKVFFDYDKEQHCNYSELSDSEGENKCGQSTPAVDNNVERRGEPSTCSSCSDIFNELKAYNTLDDEIKKNANRFGK